MAFDNGKVVRVTLRASAGELEQVNVFHYDLRDSSTDFANDPQSLADFFRDNVIQHLRALLIPNWTVDPVIVTEEKDPKAPNDPRQQWISGAASAGTRVVSSDSLPYAICAVATLKTDHIGRRATGRKFVIGSYYEADQVGGVFTTNITDGIKAYLDSVPHQPDISGPTSDSQANWSVYSRTNREQSVPTYLFHVQSYILHNEVHWLRSREP